MFGKKTESKVAERNPEMREKLTAVYNALKEKGYDPIEQIMGYLMTEDPSYMTTYNNARKIMTELDREEVFRCILKNYFSI